jgi:hypothetical protein
LRRPALIAVTVALGAALLGGPALRTSLPALPSGPTDRSSVPNPAPPPALGSLAGQYRAQLALTPAQRKAQHDAQIQAIRNANQAASEARRAEHMAAAEQAADAEWQRTGKPAQLIVVRPWVTDIITGGHLTARQGRGGGRLSLRSLAAYLPAGWVSTSGDSAVLSATLALTAGTTLDPGVANLRLSGGPDAASAASIWVGRGTLTLHNISVTSWDSGTQQAIPAAVAGRPFITVGSGGHLDATDATLSDLGAPASAAGDHHHTGVAFGPGSTGTLVRTKLVRNMIGLKLSGSEKVRLDSVTVDHSGGDGLVLHDDHGTTLKAVDLANNGRNGVLVTGAVAGRSLSGVNAHGNGDFGAAVIRQSGFQVVGLSTFENASGGLRLTGCSVCTVTGTIAAREPIGLLVDGGARQITVNNPRVHGAARGVVLSHGVTDVDIRGLYVDQSSSVGVAIAATGVQLLGTVVSNSTTAVKVSGAAARVTLTDPRITGGRDGIVVAGGASAVTLRNLVAQGVSHNSVIVSSPGVVISGGQIEGGSTGINARAPTSIEGTSVSRVGEGIHVARGVTVHGTRIDVVATHSGIKVDPEGQFILTNSRVRAHESLRGQVVPRETNAITPPPFPWLGGIGVMLIGMAVLLELLRTVLRWRSGQPEW